MERSYLFKEAAEITDYAQKLRPEYLVACGGAYSSEWFWSKVLNCLRNDFEVFEAADSWMELQDWIPFQLTGNRTAGLCAAVIKDCIVMNGAGTQMIIF